MRNLKQSNKRTEDRKRGQIHAALLRTQLPMVRNSHAKLMAFNGLLYFLWLKYIEKKPSK